MSELTPEYRARVKRWNELTEKIEGLIREYGDCIFDPEEYRDYPEDFKVDPPDWDNPLAIADWSLVIGVEDSDPDSLTRGHWVLHVEPWNQLQYRTEGLLTARLNDL